MIDPAGIKRRGAERSAPRSRSGPSAPKSQRIVRATPGLVPARAPGHASVVFGEDPPHPRLEVERGVAVTKRGTPQRLAARSGGTVEHRVPSPERTGSGARPIGRVRTELGPERRDAPPGAIACLTSARGSSDAGREPIVLTSILGRAPVGARQAACISVERGTLTLEYDVE